LNPVKTKSWKEESVSERRAFLRSYAWSSYPSYIGLVKPLLFVDYSFALNHVAPLGGNQKSAYRRYVEKGIREEDEELDQAMSQSSLAIGSEAFVEEMELRYTEEAGSRKAQNSTGTSAAGKRVDVEKLITTACSHFRIKRIELVWFRKRDQIKPVLSTLLMKYGGLAQKEIAEVVGVGTGAAVSVQVRRYREDSTGKMEKNLRAILKELNIK